MFRGGYTPSSEKRIRPIKLLTPEELPIENWPKTRILPASYGNRLMTDFSVIGRKSVKIGSGYLPTDLAWVVHMYCLCIFQNKSSARVMIAFICLICDTDYAIWHCLCHIIAISECVFNISNNTGINEGPAYFS